MASQNQRQQQKGNAKNWLKKEIPKAPALGFHCFRKAAKGGLILKQSELPFKIVANILSCGDSRSEQYRRARQQVLRSSVDTLVHLVRQHQRVTGDSPVVKQPSCHHHSRRGKERNQDADFAE